MTRRAERATLAFVLACAVLPLQAQERDAPGERQEKTVERLRPSGPVTVTADRAEWEQGGVMLYTGHVQLVADTLRLSGDQVELQQLANGHFTAKLTGAPALLQHPGETAAGAKSSPPVSAQGSTLKYDSRSGMVEIDGGAKLTRGQDAITGEQIRYDVVARRIRAAGGEGGQVRIVIQPPPDARLPKDVAPPSRRSP